MGVRIRISGDMSISVPSTISSTLISARITYLLSDSAVRKLVTRSGIIISVMM
ncbi:hypothetical protein D3C86_2239130 [compost metagenome]